jgi:predicted nucleotidyltransferase
VREVFCVGSYARGDWGVGSDLDVIVVIADTVMSLIERRRNYEPGTFPVDVDISVYTQREWDLVQSRSPILWNRLKRERIDLIPPRVAPGS